MFGADDYTADVEVIALAYQLLLDFGATPDTFEIRINDREKMRAMYASVGITDQVQVTAITRLNDRKRKISAEEYAAALLEIVTDVKTTEAIINLINNSTFNTAVMSGLRALGITNIIFDPALARGFDYYTGTIFEVFDISGENNRSLIGGGRYDNLTSMFSDEPISGIGFGMGDVTMRDFLITHGLLAGKVPVSAATLMIIPTDTDHNLKAQEIAQIFRARDIKTAVDMSTKKIGKKIADAAKHGVCYVVVVGSEEISSNTFALKDLSLETTVAGSIDEILATLIARS
jgi:histidyl-tRNA synthetase